jgi:membrane associated rhomboid family serine protease
MSDMRNVTASVGASCSIFGVMGVHLLLVYIFWKRLHPMFQQQLMSRLVLVPVLFFTVSFLPNVDWLGHIGGLLGGVAVGALLFADRADSETRIWFRIGGGGGVALLFLVPLLVIYLTDKGACA